MRAFTPLNLAILLNASIASLTRPYESSQDGDSGMRRTWRISARKARIVIERTSGIQSRLMHRRYVLNRSRVNESKLVIVTDTEAAFFGATNSLT